MEGLFTLLAVAIFIEGLVSYGNAIYKDHKLDWKIVITLIVALVVCFDIDLNFFNAFGLIEKWPIIGTVGTAITLSRGSNYMFEIYNTLCGWRNIGTMAGTDTTAVAEEDTTTTSEGDSE